MITIEVHMELLGQLLMTTFRPDITLSTYSYVLRSRCTFVTACREPQRHMPAVRLRLAAGTVIIYVYFKFRLKIRIYKRTKVLFRTILFFSLDFSPDFHWKLLYIIIFFFFWGWSGTESAITEATTGLLYQPRMVISVERSVECLTRETEVLG
jgi:hypothetical protein